MNDKKIPVITIDGPSGTGKGTICRLLAKYLHWNMLDSGAIYRVLAYAARRKGIAADQIDQLTHLATHLNLRFDSDDSESLIYLDGENVSEQVRSEECGQDASQIAVIPEVRQALLARQRNFAKLPGLVTDGRDMGTVVFPDACLKIFLYANEKERAKRRYLQLKEKGNNVSLAQVVEELIKRDTRDAARTHAPLRAAENAVQVDTTGLTIVQVFDIVLQLTNERLKSLML